MADSVEDISGVIGEAWVAADGNGLAEGIDPKNPAIKAMTMAVAEGIFAHADGFAMPKGVLLLGAKSELAPRFSKGLRWDGTRIWLEEGVDAGLIVCLCAASASPTDSATAAVAMTYETEVANGLAPSAFAEGSVLAVAF